MKPLTTTILGVLIFGLGFSLCSLWGLKKGAFNTGLEENKLAVELLSNQDLALTPEFSEYLKGRIYYNIASKYPNDRGFLLRKDWDFGKVHPTRLPPKSFAKDPTFNCSSFTEASSNLSKAEHKTENLP